jgi:uncharacterized membrane protein YkvA (DUF1232 family)
MSNPTPRLPSPPQGNIIKKTILQLRLVWRLIRDPRILWWFKLIPVGGVLYLLFPLDLIMDLAPIIGQLDDAGIILGSLWLFVELCPPDIVQEHMNDLTAVSVKATWKETEQGILPGESESTKDTKKI